MSDAGHFRDRRQKRGLGGETFLFPSSELAHLKRGNDLTKTHKPKYRGARQGNQPPKQKMLALAPSLHTKSRRRFNTRSANNYLVVEAAAADDALHRLDAVQALELRQRRVHDSLHLSDEKWRGGFRETIGTLSVDVC